MTTSELIEDYARRKRPKLVGYARMIVKNEDDAQDVVQNALLKAFRMADSYLPFASIEAWLMRITRNCALTYCGKPARRREFAHEKLTGAQYELPAPDLAYEEKELIEAALAAIAALPPSLRAVMELIFVRRYTYQEAADELHAPLGTVKVRVFRARARIRELIDGQAA
jgi:RNA polymerase sigma-70 factor (ECF subfamily)